MQRLKSSLEVCRLVVLALGLGYASTWAVDSRAAETGEWGVGTTHLYTAHAATFVAGSSNFNYGTSDVVGEGLMRGSSTVATFYATLPLPTGTSVTAIEIDGCDFDTSFGLDWGIKREPRGPATAPFEIGGHTDGEPGCGLFTETLSPPLQIDQYANSYALLAWTAPDWTTRFKAIRVYYTLQVSPAPGTATFADVPTDHWAFQHIEALAASGITAGCGGGDYCPDDTLTRAQMAVFLAKALGLHWAP